MESGSDIDSTDGRARGHKSDDAASNQLDGPDAPPQFGGTASAWKAPTTEELANIKAASELFKSNAFRLKARQFSSYSGFRTLTILYGVGCLQVESLFPPVRPKASTQQKIEPFLMSLHEHLRSLPSNPPQHPLHAFKKLRKLGVCPLLTHPPPTQETKWKVAFEPPSEIQLVGSWPNQLTVVGRTAHAFYVDLAVEMPVVSTSPCVPIICYF